MLPASLGAFIEARPFLFRMLDRLVNRGRRVPVARISGFEFLGVRSVAGPEGLGGTLAVTFTNSLIRFDDSPQGGGSFISRRGRRSPTGRPR